MDLNSEREKQPTGQAGWKPDRVISFAKDQVSQQQSFCSEDKVHDYKEPHLCLDIGKVYCWFSKT